MSDVLPKSLWKFYVTRAARGHWALIIAWAIVFIWTMSPFVWFPLLERWFVAIFEYPVAGVSEFLWFAFPTVLLIVGLNITFSASMVLRGLFMGRLNPIVSNQISEELNDYVQHQSMSFWTGRMAGKINSQIGYISNGFSLIVDGLRVMCLMAMMLINIGLVLGINSYVAIIFGAVFTFRLVFGLVLLRPMNRAAKQASESDSTLSGKIVDSLSNFSIVKLFARARGEREYLKTPRRRRIKDAIHSSFVQRIFYGVPAFVWDLSYGVMLMLCVWLYARGHMLISEIVFTMSSYYNTMSAISMIIDAVPTIVDKAGSAAKAYEELVVPIDVIDNPDAVPLVVTRGKIEFRNVWFRYKDKWVLRDLNLTINPGESLGLVGPSGAGKTTLVNLLMRFYDPTRGQILIDGQDIRTVSQDSLRENIAFIPQDTAMFNRTVAENISYGRDGATPAEVRSAARRAYADKFILGMDKKYDTLVGDRGIKLSGGQRQRIAIARAFLKDAPILVLDEATSALDSETEVAIQKSFEELAQNRTTIAIAHRLSTLRNMDRIIILAHGKIIEQGTHTQLLRKKGEYARLWHMQSGGFIQE